ncbi:MAG TPA: glycoside hydrolase family 3 C-terminal domain-containing protein, partial [Acidimicrobiales bacterium]|nr:glycoside hydrolase family 3 C-terminal domain-containing protein [Acidimicrobiales bacterium]
EVYDAPFRAAVEQAGAAAVMCSYGAIDGTPTCENHAVLNSLKRLRSFTGFVRSDESAVTDPIAAFQAGMDMIKPAANGVLAAAIADGKLAPSRLDNAVERILTEEFAFGLVGHPNRGEIGDVVRTAQHSEVALEVAEQSIVLLKDSRSVLPLERRPGLSVAVIGDDAGSGAMTAGGGGATVIAPYVVTPLQALTSALGSQHVEYVPAVPTGQASVVLAPRGSGPVPVTPFDDTASAPGSGPGWRSAATSYTPAASGTYVVSMSSYGDSFLTMEGGQLQSLHGIDTWPSPQTSTAVVDLVAHSTYHFALSWFSQVPSQPVVSVQDVSGAIASAVAAAKSVEVPIVFAGAEETEGEDRPNLSLPGYQDELISAVAAANPRTVVVLNTGGAVLVPWLRDVAALLEAWYPGEEDGAAIAAVLLGRVDPSGRLPVTFPVTQASQPLSSPSEWPGIDGSVAFSDGLDIGYRGYLAEGKKMRFPFGFGLSYTRFRLSDLAVSATPAGDSASVLVDNVGDRPGREVVEAYLAFPASAGEPPEQLVAVGSAELTPGATATVTLDVPASAFEADLGGRWRTVPGSYELSIGTSAARPDLQTVLPAPG